MKTEKTICEGCGKKAAGGGHRFCYGCIGILLNKPTLEAPPAKPWSGGTGVEWTKQGRKT
jgi:hypothetical protein